MGHVIYYKGVQSILHGGQLYYKVRQILQSGQFLQGRIVQLFNISALQGCVSGVETNFGGFCAIDRKVHQVLTLLICSFLKRFSFMKKIRE